MKDSRILDIQPMGRPWAGIDPFLFAMHHEDAYPKGNGELAPVASMEGREMGSDFSGKDGWSMYHGGPVPGFPAHPHRGFETITIVRNGYVDHADSAGGAARYGMGDVQWLTAGGGVLHSEMFPLVHTDKDNPLDLFQIWLNLPAKSKHSPAHFSMFWADQIPTLKVKDSAGNSTTVTVIAGELEGAAAPLSPPPDSWASNPDADVGIWIIQLDPGAKWVLPGAANAEAARMLYFYKGKQLDAGEDTLAERHIALVKSTEQIELHNPTDAPIEVLMLQGKPIGEPVAKYGPFVMNTDTEIQQAFLDFQRTKFGRWHYPTPAPTHGHDAVRFARYPDGREEKAKA